MFVGGGAFLVAWMAAAAGPAPADSVEPGQSPVAVEAPNLAALRGQTSRLRERLRRIPRPVSTVRNPFRFADRRRVASRSSMTPAPAVPAAMTPGSSRSDAVLRLIGIAESRTAEGVVRTAILSALGKTLLVTTGDELSMGYTVGTVGAEAVELRDADGRTITLSF